MLVFVALIHALPTRKGKYPIHSSRGSFASMGGQIKRNAFVHEKLAFMQSELFLSPAF
jgi:hypothetical protein